MIIVKPFSLQEMMEAKDDEAVKVALNPDFDGVYFELEQSVELKKHLALNPDFDGASSHPSRRRKSNRVKRSGRGKK